MEDPKELKPNVSYSVVILNFSRPNNIPLVLHSLLKSKKIEKIIISNGKLETAVTYDDPKVLIFNDCGNVNDTYGLDRRFLRMLDCPTEHIIIIDDDIIIDEPNLNKLLIEYEKDTKRIVGSTGRNVIQDKSIKYNTKNVYKHVDITLTKLLVCQQKLAHLFFYCKPLVEEIYKTGVPYGNGEDIFFSFITRLYYDRPNYALEGIHTKDLGNDSVAVGRMPNHLIYRNKLCNFLYSNKPLFKDHIDKFIFPTSHEQSILTQEILPKETSKNLVLTISIGKSRNFLEITEKYMKQYAEKCQADFILLNNDSSVILLFDKIFSSLILKCGRNYGGNSYFYKVYSIYYFLEKYDKILWLDDSCIVSPNTENLFNMLNDGSVAGYAEGTNPHLNSWKSDFNLINSIKKFKIDTTKYLNSGIVLYTKDLRHLFSLENILLHKDLFKSSYPHQCYLNYVLQVNNIPIICLDEKYNNLCLYYDYSKLPSNNNTIIDREYIKQNNSSIFHITGWWLNRYEVLKNIDKALN
jgi:hypothetical protein